MSNDTIDAVSATETTETIKTIKISSYRDLCKIGNDPAYPMDGHYEQMCDIDFTDDKNEDEEFKPIGRCNDNDTVTSFSGKYSGNGFTIKGLNITYRGSDHFGMFASLEESAIVTGVNLSDVLVMGMKSSGVGALAGHNLGTIIDCNVLGTVQGKNEVGGLVGSNMGDIDRCSFIGSVSGDDMVGGLVGQLFGDYTLPYIDGDGDKRLVEHKRGMIDNCDVKARVFGKNGVGGIVGSCINGMIFGCNIDKDRFASCVKGKSSVGGLAGTCIGGLICGGGVSVDMDGERFVGGVVGSSDSTLSSMVAINGVEYSGNCDSLLGFYGDVRFFSARDILEKVREYCVVRGIDLEDFMFHNR